jgi:PhnB protein
MQVLSAAIDGTPEIGRASFGDEVDMQVNPYLTFSGTCEAAFKFYAQCLGGRLGAIFRYAGTPLADQVPADWQDKVMHGSLTLGELVLMGADVAPDRYEAPKGVSLSIQIKNTTDAERIFRELGGDGRIVLALEKTFWADRFGMVVDRYGIPWLINCEGVDQPPGG